MASKNFSFARFGECFIFIQLCREMTCRATVYTTWILDDKFPNSSGSKPLIAIIEKWLQTSQVSFSDDIVAVLDVVLAC